MGHGVLLRVPFILEFYLNCGSFALFGLDLYFVLKPLTKLLAQIQSYTG